MRTEQEKNLLLASVSRSFYLTIRALPKTIRHPIRTAYLLARITDTIADTNDIPVEDREQHLETLRRAILETATSEELLTVAIQVTPRQTNQAEKILLTQLLEVMEDYQSLASEDHADVKWVLGEIIIGQTEDLRTRQLPDAAALERYTWLVAGCVGEFWTKICSRKLRNFSVLTTKEMLVLGGDYGKGLQLVNILRDVSEDRVNGRNYLPENDDYTEWLKRADTLLQSGWRYVLVLNSWRMRFACALPVLIGRKTLRLLEANPDQAQKQKLKITRVEIRKIIFQTAWRAPFRSLMASL